MSEVSCTLEPEVAPTTTLLQAHAGRLGAVIEHIRLGMHRLEPIRRRWLVWSLMSWTVGLGLAAATYHLFASGDVEPRVCYASAGGSLVVFLALRKYARHVGARLHSAFDAWRQEGVRLLDNEANFDVDDGLVETTFDASGVNDAAYNRYSSSDLLCVAGIQASSLSVQHVHTETYWETMTDYSSGSPVTRSVPRQRTVVQSIFEGLLIVLPARMPHQARILLRQRDCGLPNGFESLQVASPSLAKHYAVGSSDKFAGHRLLTPALMESLWTYQAQFKGWPVFSYRHDKLYVAVPDYRLTFGGRPGKWLTVTAMRLEKVLVACQTSIQFLRSTSETLMPT